ncbi:MAG TPA: hypothetical protein VF594_00940 [Rubricoccaceae bacterium]|jgi:hypothetical protein
MIRRITATALILAALSGCAASGGSMAASRSSFTRRPLTEMPPLPVVRLDSLRTAYPNLPMAYLTDERTIEHQFDFPSEWDFVQDVRRQYVVLDPDDTQATTFGVTLGRRDVLEGAHLRLVSPDGAESVFALADLVREQDGGAVSYKFAYPNVVAGSVIEESYRLRQTTDRTFQPPLYHDIALQREVPVDQMTVRYVYPSSWSLAVKQVGPQRMPEFQLDRTTLPHSSILTVRRDHVAPFADEPYSPFFKEVAPYLEFAVTAIHVGDVLPLYQAPTSWEALATDFGRYAFKRRGGATGPVAQQARSVADPAAPDSVRLASIVSWVQTNIEPVDEGGATDLRGVLQSHRANDLLITGLTQAMLEESGLDADFILIHPMSEGYFDPQFIDIRQFTAPAVLVRLEGTDRVVFPYVEGLPITYIPENYQGATAMRLSAEGLGGFVRLPASDLSQSTIDEVTSVAVDAEGIVRVEETTTLRGAAAFGFRALIKDLTAEERAEEMERFVTYDEGSFRDFTHTVEGESAAADALVLTLRYTVDDLVTVTPEEVLFQTGGLLSPAALSTREATPGRRRNPVRIYHNSVTNKTIRVQYPEAWTLTTALADVREDSRFGQSTGSYASTPGLLTATQRTQLRAGSAAATEASALERLTGSESRLNVPTLVFSVAP